MAIDTSLQHVLAAMRAQVDVIQARARAVRAGRDPEDLHQMRVAVRRLRAILRAGRPLFERRWVEGLRRELDWLGTALGEVRDLDILRAHLGPRLGALGASTRPAGRRLLRRIDVDRARARSALRSALDSPRYPRLIARLEAALRHPRVGRRDVSLLGVAAAAFRKLRRAVKALPWRPRAEDLHALRIRVKRARYGAELVRATAGRRADRFLDQARKIQDILGEHQDTVVIQGYLHEAMDRTEPGHALAQSLIRAQRKRRKKARAAFFDEWPRLERRGRRAWGA
ncbi:MAG TPA: CHAD domain-containing protein [Methylomirabilota bacterium]|jgi:CHAD domain-containing protein